MVGIVGIYDGCFGLLAGGITGIGQHLEQAHFVGPVLGDTAMEVEVLASDIGKHRHIKTTASQALPTGRQGM